MDKRVRDRLNEIESIKREIEYSKDNLSELEEEIENCEADIYVYVEEIEKLEKEIEEIEKDLKPEETMISEKQINWLNGIRLS